MWAIAASAKVAILRRYSSAWVAISNLPARIGWPVTELTATKNSFDIQKGIGMSVPQKALVMGAREWILLLVLSVIWGCSFFFFKVLVAELPPFTVVLGRVGLAAVLLNLFSEPSVQLVHQWPASGLMKAETVLRGHVLVVCDGIVGIHASEDFQHVAAFAGKVQARSVRHRFLFRVGQRLSKLSDRISVVLPASRVGRRRTGSPSACPARGRYPGRRT